MYISISTQLHVGLKHFIYCQPANKLIEIISSFHTIPITYMCI